MKLLKKLVFIVLILISTIAVAGPLELSIAQKSIPEPAQMLILGICLVGMAAYGRKKIYKK